MDGKWIREPKNSTVVVFVHGILSNREECWTHEKGSYWPELLKQEKEKELEAFGIYVFSYKTGVFSRDYSLSDAVDSLKENMRIDKVLQCKRIIFVCHSMGGIVVRKFIVQRAALDLIDKKIEVALYLVASPSLGSRYADWLEPIAKFFGNSQADVLRFSQNNAWLSDLDRDFLNLKESKKLLINGKELVEDKFIIFKKLLIIRQVVEPISGARYFGDPFKVPNSDHFSIAKPENNEAIQHRLLCEFIKSLPEPALPRVQQTPSTDKNGATFPIFNVPHLQNPFFTGREEILNNLKTALNSKKAAALTQAISGLGGIGKTQIAIEYAYRFEKEYKIVWWIKSEENTTLTNDYASLATKLQLPECEVADQAVVVEAVKNWLDKNSGWLLIFDNATNPDDIRQFIPQHHLGHIIITSQKKEWGEIGKGLSLTYFTRDESIYYLCNRTESDDKTAANELAELLGDLPLALAQAAGFIVSTQKTIAGYIKLFNENKAELLKRKGKDSEYPFTVATTWSLSLKQAKKQAPLAEDLLKLTAFFAPDNIPRELLKDGLTQLKEADDIAFEDAIAALHDNSLIELAEKSVSVHRLVQFVTSEQIIPDEKKKYIKTTIQVINDAFYLMDYSPSDVRSWSRSTLLLPHVTAVISMAEETNTISEELGKLMSFCGMYWYGRANYINTEYMYRGALAVREQRLGVNHPDTAASMNNLSQLLGDQGKYAEAETMCRCALKIVEQQLGIDHETVGVCLNTLAIILYEQKKFEEAEPLLRRSLKIREEQFGVDHPSVATALNSLASLLDSLGRSVEAESIFRRALKIREKHLGNDHPNLATSLCNFAESLRLQGRYSEAETISRRALKIREDQLGDNHPDVANSLNNLGLMLKTQGKYDEADPIYRRSLVICEEQLGRDHPHTRLVRQNLETLLKEWKQHDKNKSKKKHK